MVNTHKVKGRVLLIFMLQQLLLVYDLLKVRSENSTGQQVEKEFNAHQKGHGFLTRVILRCDFVMFSVLVYQCSCKNYHKLGDFNKSYSLSCSSGGQSLKLSCQQSWFFLENLGKNLFLVSPSLWQLLEIHDSFCLVAELHHCSLCLHCYISFFHLHVFTWHSLCVSVCPFFLLRTTVVGFRVHPNLL